MADTSLFYSNSILVWLIVVHTLFLVIPALIAASDEWIHQSGFRFKSFHRAKSARYPHYLAH